MKKIILIIIVTILLAFILFGFEDARLLRMPDINKDLMVFVYAGDIWSVPAAGGEARRLTSHMGMEIFPKISPDGRWIVFSGEYSGSRQIYVIPSSGGTPRQLTYYNDVGELPPRGGFDNYPLDWTPDSKKILFHANRTPYGVRQGKYYLVSLDGGLEVPLQIPDAGGGTFSPSGKEIVYTPISREFRTWKRYKGGRAQDVWIYDLVHDTAKRLTTFEGSDLHPVWFKDKVYFVSDRDLILNIYSYDLKTEKVQKVTDHREYDVLWPSGEGGLIAYENGGHIWKFDAGTGKSEKIKIDIRFDNPNILPHIITVSDTIGGVEISPTGKRGLFEARGDLYTVPAKEGITYNLTRTQGVREVNPSWSPDGRTIAYCSDQTGEYEIYLMDTSKDNEVTQVTFEGTAWKFQPVWSPDSTKLLFSDRNLLLRFVDVKTKKLKIVDKARRANIFNYDWSPDSKWIVYTKDGNNGQTAVWVYSLEKDEANQLTNDLYNDFSPVFSKCGNYIFFLSTRDFNLNFSSYEFDYVFSQATRIYSLALRKSAPPLFKDKNDMEEPKKEEAKTDKAAPEKDKPKEASKDEKEKPAVGIDFEGADDRVVVIPLPPGNYGGLFAVDGGLLFFRNGEVHKFTFEDKKDTLIIAGIQNGAVSADGKKLLYLAQGAYGIIDIAPNQKPGDGKLNLDDMTMKLDPTKEWVQIYNDAWRIYRDWFYVANMHGVDWDKMREKYARWLPFLSHRGDLDHILGELVGELNVGHTYISWGNFPRVPRLNGGLLGAELEADEKAGRYILKKIYKGENWNEDVRSPLTEQGIDIKEGEYILSLNGVDVTTRDNPYRFLENTAGKKVSITVNSKPDKEGSREFWIRPVASEQRLFYLDWVLSRRAMVDKLSGGRVGYFHVPDTAVDGNREFFKGMYAFYNKDALIIDERYNGGGFTTSVMIDMLSRQLLSYWARRGMEMLPTPGVVHKGPKAMLINHFSSSGGDDFPYNFKNRKLGIVIGTRTWGGLVGLSGNAGLVDGTAIAVPTIGIVSTDGGWDVEGMGISPDIEVWDLPDLVAKGRDPSLEKAVEVLMEELKKNPPKKVEKPKDPDRSKWHEKKEK
ncbi:MAG: PDZ domain-containing protein [Candidatus Aminicenantales bacterium]